MERVAVSLNLDQKKRYAGYSSYESDRYYIFKVYEIIKSLNEKQQLKRVLDVGCADGKFSAKLKDDFNFEMYGIDISCEAIKKAKKKGIKAVCHNAQREFPYPKNFFDLILGCEIIEHLYDTDFFIDELKRVLKKDGFLILTTPNLASAINRIKILFGQYPYESVEYKIGGAGHIRAYTIPVLKKQLSSHGLKKVLITSPNFPFPMASKKVPAFVKKIFLKTGGIFPSIGSHIIALYQK